MLRQGIIKITCSNVQVVMMVVDSRIWLQIGVVCISMIVKDARGILAGGVCTALGVLEQIVSGCVIGHA